MHTKLVAFLIAVTAALLIACSPELAPSPTQVTGTDGSTATAHTRDTYDYHRSTVSKAHYFAAHTHPHQRS